MPVMISRARVTASAVALAMVHLLAHVGGDKYLQIRRAQFGQSADFDEREPPLGQPLT
jgi:hypothetical protein